MHVLLAVALTIAYPFNGKTMERQDIKACFEHLFAAAYFGKAPVERAAFLVLQDGGSLACQDWPPTFSFKSERWDGPIPDGTVAIAHTHPARLRQPSRDDIAAAEQLGIPVFVVTEGWIAMAAPDSTVTFATRK